MKSKITLKSGEVIEFDPLVYDEKNLIKTRMHNEGNDGEGIWAIISDEDKVKYDEDRKGDYVVVMLANSSIYFALGQSWGMHVVVRLQGNQRPEGNWNWVDYNLKENRIFSEDVPEDKRY